jgi:transcriptional regulator with XRE-family HTH domain
LRGYWARLIRCIRQAAQLSQTELSERLGTDQGTVSRWERGVSIPQHDTQKLLDGLARELGLSSLEDIANIVRFSPFPMILVDRAAIVIAASATSGFSEGLDCIAQTPAEERAYLIAFDRALAESGFWDHQCSHFEYEFKLDSVVRRAVVVPVPIRGDMYALVQKA